MFYQIIGIIFPVFAIVGIGIFYAKKHSPDMSGANEVNYNIFIPALIFHVLSQKGFHIEEYQNLALASIAVVLGSGLLTWPIAKIFRYNIKTFVPPMMFGNSGNMGLPLAVLAFGEKALPAAVILFLVENTLHFSLGIKIIHAKASLFSILKIPMVATTIAGLLFSFAEFTLLPMFEITIKMIGQVAIPLMLFSLGTRLATSDLSEFKIGFIGALAAPFSGFVIFLCLFPFLKLPEIQMHMLLVFSVLPPAVLNYVVAEKYNQEPVKVASIVMLGNLMSLLTMPLIFFYVFSFH